MEFIEELLLIRGISKELYYGVGSTPGLRDLVTVHGDDGTINVNTAPKLLLLALNADMTDELAEKMVSFREDKENESLLENANWYQQVGSWPGDVAFDPKLLTTVSKHFNILSLADHNDMQKSLTAVIFRDGATAMSTVFRRVE